MGAVSLKIGDGTAKFRRSFIYSTGINLLMLLSLLSTNLFALYSFTSSVPSSLSDKSGNDNLTAISEHVAAILREIDSSQKTLYKIQMELTGFASLDPSSPSLPGELRVFLGRHGLPLGKDSKTGITEMVSSVGHPCVNSMDLVAQFLNYKVGGVCPDDGHIAQGLVMRGCSPLPRRRCLTRAGNAAVRELMSFPRSLWKTVGDNLINWSRYKCKNFKCFKGKTIEGCVDCFDLVNGAEKQRWDEVKDKNDFLIDDVLKLGRGGMRIGIDIGGGTGNFAARMADKNVTIITVTPNSNAAAPFNEFIAARGLFPLFLNLGQRFPFFDGAFDMVHMGDGVLKGIPIDAMQFLLFDVDRILRAGGLLWLDRIYVPEDELKTTHVNLIEKFGYKKLKWVVGEKSDSSVAGRKEVYWSAVLRKPVRV